MTNRVKQLWLPVILTFTVSIALEVLGPRLGPRLFFLHLDKGTPILPFYTGWLLTHPWPVHLAPISQIARVARPE